MAVFKATVFFSYKKSGWSETYYKTGTSMGAVVVMLNNLVILRAAMLADKCKIDYARLSNVDNERDSFPAKVDELVQFDTNFQTDTPWQAILFRLYSTARYQRPLYIRGIPDIMFISDTPTAAQATGQINWRTAAKNFMNGLITDQWQIRAQAKSDVTGFAPTPVDKFSLGVGPTLVLHTTVVSGLIVNQPVVVYARGFKPPIGHTYVTAVNNVAQTVEVAYNGIVPTTSPRSGSIKAYGIVFKEILSYQEENITHRITGRPFGLQAGRRRNRA